MKRKIASLLLVGCMAMSMAACGGKDASADADNRVYAVEAGSAGEAVAQGSLRSSHLPSENH